MNCPSDDLWNVSTRRLSKSYRFDYLCIYRYNPPGTYMILNSILVWYPSLMLWYNTAFPYIYLVYTMYFFSGRSKQWRCDHVVQKVSCCSIAWRHQRGCPGAHPEAGNQRGVRDLARSAAGKRFVCAVRWCCRVLSIGRVSIDIDRNFDRHR